MTVAVGRTRPDDAARLLERQTPAHATEPDRAGRAIVFSCSNEVSGRPNRR